MLTKFVKLSVGKYVVSSNWRNSSKDLIFPLAVALSGLHPITKIWVDYEPQPKNKFVIKVNDVDIHSFVREEIDFDPTKTETLKVNLTITNKVEFINIKEI